MSDKPDTLYRRTLSTDTKQCEHCGATYGRGRRNRSWWARSRYCSHDCSGAARKTAPLERFHSSYTISENGCWDWSKSTSTNGYGDFFDGKKLVAAHRFAVMALSGLDIPSGMVVMHKCDNPACVNPDHLEIGTQSENLADMRSKRRHAYGELASYSKLTSEQVLAIRRSSDGTCALAREHGVVPSVVSQIRNRKSWRHL